MAHLNNISYQLRHSMSWVKPLLLVSVLAMSPPVLAAVQLDDQELDQNYLKGDAKANILDIEEIFRQVHDKKIDQIFFTFVPLASISTLSFLLDDYSQEQLVGTDAFRLISSSGEVASYNLGSEQYSYRWSGNYDRVFDINKYQSFYLEDTTGSYEISNIQGRLDVETRVFKDDRRADFFKSYYVF